MNSDCTYYYLVTYWSDGSTDYDYLGSYCNDGPECEPLIAISNDPKLKIKMLCGGGGGGATTPTIINTKNNLKDSCLKKIANDFLNSNLSNVVTDILKNVFSVGDHVNLSFEENTSIHDSQGNSIPAKTSGTLGPTSSSPIDETVYLNPDMLNTSSQEFKASVIIHEIIHSSLNVKGIDLNQHMNMLQNYMDAMSKSLKVFFRV